MDAKIKFVFVWVHQGAKVVASWREYYGCEARGLHQGIKLFALRYKAADQPNMHFILKVNWWIIK